jgi:hypothetical protein
MEIKAETIYHDDERGLLVRICVARTGDALVEAILADVLQSPP